MATSGMSRSGTYEALGDGRLRAVKLGSKTLVDFEHGLVYLASLPAAKITTGRGRDRRGRHNAPVGPSSPSPIRTVNATHNNVGENWR